MLTTKSYAAQNATSPLAPYQFERRTPGLHDVQIEILYCGVCHSDIHQVRNEWGGAKYPMVPGHEIVGRVTAVGAQVTKFKVGDTAGVGCLVDACRTCNSCSEGNEQYCENGSVGTYNSYEKNSKTLTQGGYSDKIVVDENFVLKVSNNLPLEKVAPLLCAGITTYSPLRQWKVGKGHKVGILGLGGLGHMAVKFAVTMGAEVTVLSTSPGKKNDALQLGAHKFIVTKNHDEVKAVRNYFHFIIDTVSAQHDINFYTSLLGVDGTLIMLGIPPEAPQLQVFNLVGKRRSIAGSLIGGIAETQEMLDYCAANNITSDVEVIPINYINQAYERMIKGDVHYRFVIDVKTL
ncbi:MAG: NAD(P)-dependent alcohol dehydrogenase [Chitinophagales bacterium]|nr:NAD(P)-dependent alcohol dehydrogenase [Chitinophagales bacterium]